MALQWPAPLYVDDTSAARFSTAQPCSLPVFSSPIDATTKEYVFTQDFIQYRKDFTATALNTAHYSTGLTPDYSSFRLVNEGERRDILGGLVQWTRTYAIVPDTYSDYETFSYGFIGTLTVVPDGTQISRVTKNWVVPTRLQHDFYLVGTGGSYTTAGDIPKILAMRYVYQVTYLGAIYGGVTTETQILNPTGSTEPTWPTSDQYNTMISDALSNKWSATVSNVVLFPTNTLAGGPPATSGHMAGTVDTATSVLGGQIPVEDSRLVRWNGNIWERITRYALAQ